MNVVTKIDFTLEDVLHELGEIVPVQHSNGILVSGMQDKFFKGGGCEALSPIAVETVTGNTVPRNIAICTNKQT